MQNQPGENQFVETELNVSAKRTETLFRSLFMMMAGLLILPVLIILTTLIVKGSSMISYDFLFTIPTDGMTAGGIFPALLGTVWLVGVALVGGMLATLFVVVVAYYATLVAVRLGLDPDTYGIPLVTSSLDFVGAFTLIFAIVLWGLT